MSGNRRFNLAYGAATVVKQCYLLKNTCCAHIVVITRKNGEYFDGQETYVTKHRWMAIGVLGRENDGVSLLSWGVSFHDASFDAVVALSSHVTSLPTQFKKSGMTIPFSQRINKNCWQLI